MTATPSSISSTRPLTISDLPDIPLLVIFDHLPLLDLFNRIPLVCPRWTTLQSAALTRRTRLHLLSDIVSMQRETLPDVSYYKQDVIWQNWYQTDDGKTDQARIALDRLPLPTTYHGWTTATGGRLLRPEAAEWLWAKLPNITELTLAGLIYSSSKFSNLYNDVDAPIRCRERVQEQAIRLVTQGQRWCSRLSTLRCYMWTWIGSLHSPTDAELANELVSAINCRMPSLSVLQLGSMPDKTSVLLTGDTFARLRLFNGTGYDSDWLCKSLYTAKLGHLRPDLCIVLDEMWDFPCVEQQPKSPDILAHIKLLEWLEQSPPIGIERTLQLVPQRFPALCSLTLHAHGVESPKLGLRHTLRRLMPLTSLVHLVLYFWNIVPDVSDGGGETDEEEEHPIMSSLQSLVLQLSRSHLQSYAHTDLGNALDWATSLPRLERLDIDSRFLTYPCALCQPGQIFNVRDRPFFGIYSGPKCRRLTVEPLQVCPRLETIVFEGWNRKPPKCGKFTATRTDLSAPFQTETFSGYKNKYINK